MLCTRRCPGRVEPVAVPQHRQGQIDTVPLYLVRVGLELLRHVGQRLSEPAGRRLDPPRQAIGRLHMHGHDVVYADEPATVQRQPVSARRPVQEGSESLNDGLVRGSRFGSPVCPLESFGNPSQGVTDCEEREQLGIGHALMVSGMNSLSQPRLVQGKAWDLPRATHMD